MDLEDMEYARRDAEITYKMNQALYFAHLERPTWWIRIIRWFRERGWK